MNNMDRRQISQSFCLNAIRREVAAQEVSKSPTQEMPAVRTTGPLRPIHLVEQTPQEELIHIVSVAPVMVQLFPEMHKKHVEYCRLLYLHTRFMVNGLRYEILDVLPKDGEPHKIMARVRPIEVHS
ncbi:MAG TPA: hypothetical protein VHL10_01290 [Nitrososphaera sp.]|jgi:hypothetical protein|nr:hypothetical protein [Nitrososphaera sp.]